MEPNQPLCSRCGVEQADVWWSSALFVEVTHWLCTDCVNAVLLLWLFEHESLIDGFLTRKDAEGGHPGPA